MHYDTDSEDEDEDAGFRGFASTILGGEGHAPQFPSDLPVLTRSIPSTPVLRPQLSPISVSVECPKDDDADQNQARQSFSQKYTREIIQQIVQHLARYSEGTAKPEAAWRLMAHLSAEHAWLAPQDEMEMISLIPFHENIGTAVEALWKMALSKQRSEIDAQRIKAQEAMENAFSMIYERLPGFRPFELQIAFAAKQIAEEQKESAAPSPAAAAPVPAPAPALALTPAAAAPQQAAAPVIEAEEKINLSLISASSASNINWSSYPIKCTVFPDQFKNNKAGFIKNYATHLLHELKEGLLKHFTSNDLSPHETQWINSLIQRLDVNAPSSLEVAICADVIRYDIHVVAELLWEKAQIALQENENTSLLNIFEEPVEHHNDPHFQSRNEKPSIYKALKNISFNISSHLQRHPLEFHSAFNMYRLKADELMVEPAEEKFPTQAAPATDPATSQVKENEKEKKMEVENTHTTQADDVPSVRRNVSSKRRLFAEQEEDPKKKTPKLTWVDQPDGASPVSPKQDMSAKRKLEDEVEVPQKMQKSISDDHATVDAAGEQSATDDTLILPPSYSESLALPADEHPEISENPPPTYSDSIAVHGFLGNGLGKRKGEPLPEAAEKNKALKTEAPAAVEFAFNAGNG